MLHGLGGYAGEWSDTARWLTARARVVALDARGHGASTRYPADVSSAALVDDAAFAVEHFGIAPVVAIGQSLGGLIALLLAARHPELVSGLVVAEASAARGRDAVVGDVAAG